MNRNLTRSLAGSAALALLVLLGACSGGGVEVMSDSSDESGSMDSGAGVEGEAPGAAPREAAADGLAKRVTGANRTVFQVRSVIRTGEVSVTSKDLDNARTRLDALLTTLGGAIDSERTTHDDDGDIKRSTLVLRVPVAEFGAAMTALQELGKVKHSDTASKDVTTEVIDVDERVQTLQNSLDRLQAYQRDAKDIDDLLRFEQQITQRESELQSLKAQQSYLADQTSMSTITLTLATPRRVVEPPSKLDDAGFVAGLKSGWNALGSAVVVMLTVVGAVLPFAVVLLLVGIPVWLLVRRTVRSHADAATAASSTPAAPPTP